MNIQNVDDPFKITIYTLSSEYMCGIGILMNTPMSPITCTWSCDHYHMTCMWWSCDSHMAHLDGLLGAHCEVLSAPGWAEASLVIHVQQVTLCIDHSSKQDCLVLLLVVVVFCERSLWILHIHTQMHEHVMYIMYIQRMLLADGTCSSVYLQLYTC